MDTIPELLPDEYLITSQSKFLDKLNELIANGYSYTDDNFNTDTLILDVANWGDEYLQYDRILSDPEHRVLDILFFKVFEERKVFIVCTKRFKK